MSRGGNWPKKRLGDVADLCLGKMLDQKKNKGEPRPYLANINVRWGEFDLDNLRQMRFEENETERYGLKAGDIVMCEGGEPGRCAIWKDQEPGMMIQKALHRIRPHDSIDNQYLFYAFLQNGRNGGFSPLFTGSTIKHLPGQNLAKVEVEVPPLPTQHRIASVLSAYDDLIENNRRRIQLLEQAARMIYKEWFVRLRFPGHEHVTITDGVPEGWARVNLRDVCVVNPEQLPSRFDGSIIYVDIASVGTDSIDDSTEMDFSEAPSRARRVVRDGDIIWSTVRPNRRSHAIISQPAPNMVVSTGFAVLRPSAVPTSFLYYATTTSDFVGYLTNNAGGAAYPAVTAPVFENAEVLLPPKLSLVGFDDLITPILNQKSRLSRSVEALTRARDILLPRLMNGEIEI